MAHKCTYNSEAKGICENGNAFCNGKDAQIKSARLIIEVADTNLNEARIEVQFNIENFSNDLEGYNQIQRGHNLPEYKSLAECHADTILSDLELGKYSYIDNTDKIEKEAHGPSHTVRKS